MGATMLMGPMASALKRQVKATMLPTPETSTGQSGPKPGNGPPATATETTATATPPTRMRPTTEARGTRRARRPPRKSLHPQAMLAVKASAMAVTG